MVEDLGVIGRAKLLGLLALGALALGATAADGESTQGPRLGFTEWRVKKPMLIRLASVNPYGKERQGLVLGPIEPAPFDGPAWSADGTALAFAGYPAPSQAEKHRGEGGDRPLRLFLISPLGTPPQEFSGTVGASRPVFSPDGSSLAYSRSKLIQHFDPKDPLRFKSYFSVTSWIVPLDGDPARRLTPWRNGLVNEPTSFSPDGQTLLMLRDKGVDSASEVVATDLAEGSDRVLARNAKDPTFSPDGSQIALISFRDHLTVPTGDRPAAVGELYVIDTDGSHPRRLTRTPTEGESQPSWDPSGSRIAFVRAPGGGGIGFANVLMQVNADGSCARRVLGRPGRDGLTGPGLYGPSWQPGPGREAGPIAC
jgi:Tol biopolymer transport system component